jgi:voltage-gated potassium channel
MQPEDPKEPKPPAKETEEPKPEQDHDIHRTLWQRTRFALPPLVVTCLLWGIFFVYGSPFTSHVYLGFVNIIITVMLVVLVTAQLISVSRSGDLINIVIMLLTSFSSLVATFSTLYGNYGTTGNFSEGLTRLDAIYFTVGTLATAGTGNISAISQTARGLQTLQMVLDIGFLVFAVSLVVAKISSRMDKRRDQNSNL